MSTSTRSIDAAPRATPNEEGGRRRLRIAPRAIALLAGVILIGAATVYPARLWVEQKAQLAELARQTDALQVENELLAGQIRKLRDPAYLEQLARACLGMVRRGETAFVIIPPDGGGMPTVPCGVAMDDGL